MVIVNLLAALNFAKVFLNKKRLENKKNVKKRKKVTKMKKTSNVLHLFCTACTRHHATQLSMDCVDPWVSECVDLYSA